MVLMSSLPLSNDLRLVIDVFEALFLVPHNTQLIAGADEPVYLPASDESGAINRLFFREDFLPSALHETAHWCIAGTERLKREDFGYWYNPDGRTAAQQRVFEAAEVKPQALEWMFSRACGQKFRLSIDNLSTGQVSASQSFAQAVCQQAVDWCVEGALPRRAELFLRGLMEAFQTSDIYNPRHYQLNRLI